MEIIQSTGLSITSLLRGVSGMLVLIFIAYLLSNNRRAISWKTVGIGLFIQVLIAIGVLKIKFVKNIFEILGSFFIKVLEYTGEGTKMLLGDLDFHPNSKRPLGIPVGVHFASKIGLEIVCFGCRCFGMVF